VVKERERGVADFRWADLASDGVVMSYVYLCLVLNYNCLRARSRLRWRLRVGQSFYCVFVPSFVEAIGRTCCTFYSTCRCG
jgi:hypothetical protein